MQQNPLVSYIIKLTFFSIGVSLIGLFSLLFLSKDWIFDSIPYLIILFYSITGISYTLIYLTQKSKKMRFENIFMITKFSKLLIYIIVLIVAILLPVTNIKAFLSSYAILYILYTIFDIITLNQLAKKLK